MSPRPVLVGGRVLTDWIRAGGRPDRASRAAVFLYSWRAFWFDQGLGLARAAAPVPSRFPEGEGLLFVMGFWRSGTTVLHEMLAELPGWGAPETWQCMDPLAAMRGGRPPAGPAVRRPMDAVEVGPRSPQEDEFALLALGVPSLYRGFIDPRRLSDLRPLLDQGTWLGQETGPWTETLAGFLGLCQKEGQEALAVKSPNHVFRYRALVRRFPRARFVWILRDPADLWASNVRMWQAMTDRYGLWHTPPGGLESFLESALGAFMALLRDLRKDGTFRKDVVLSYEDLVREPERSLRHLSGLLGVDSMEAEAWLESAATRLTAAPRGRNAGLPEGPPALLEGLRTIQEAILADAQS